MKNRLPNCYALRCGNRSLVLFTSIPSAIVMKAMRATKTQIGLVVFSKTLPDTHAFDGLDYLFVATRSERNATIKTALRDLSRQQWESNGVGRAN